jgi:hypothetical protein
LNLSGLSFSYWDTDRSKNVGCFFLKLSVGKKVEVGGIIAEE